MTPAPPPKVYVTNHQHSRVVCSAFAAGCKGQLVPAQAALAQPLPPGLAVVYGVLRGCGEVMRRCEWVERDYLHIDLGYFRRGHYDGYYRVSLNGRQLSELQTRSSDRWDRLGFKSSPWRKTGRHVLVIPIPPGAAGYLGVDATTWLDTVLAEIRLHTDRPILVKPKEDGDLKTLLSDAWCLVTHSSNAAVVALMNGIPAVTLGDSAARGIVDTSLADIERPFYPANRDDWLHWLAYNQFTLEEFSSGLAWSLLRDQYDF